MHPSGGNKHFRPWFLPALSAALLTFFFSAASPDRNTVLDLTICQIQGSGSATPYGGQQVRTRGVVTLDFDSVYEQGFYIQDENCDADPATSDALYVYLDQKLDMVSPGDEVEVTGWAVEFAGLTEISVPVASVTLLGVRALPAPAPFSPPWGNTPSKAYFEAHEGMRVAMQAATVVGPTNGRGETFVVDSSWGVDRVFQGSPGGAIVRVDQGGPYKIIPDAAVGDIVLGLNGVLAHSLGHFRLQLDSAPSLVPGKNSGGDKGSDSSLTFATLNLHNLFDTVDDPNTQDPVLSASAYQTKLQKLAIAIHDELGEPVFMALQEAENAAVLQALANRPELSVQYLFSWIDGPDSRGIDTALFYRSDQAILLISEARQGCTGLIDGLGPDGNQNVYAPQNALTCDLDGLPGWDGNRLFSRPPLVAHLQTCDPDCSPGGQSRLLWVIVIHLKSKSQDTEANQYTLPRRIEQAAFLVALFQEIKSNDPQSEIVLLGDFNDYPDSQPLQLLESAGLVNLIRGVTPGSRYTYNYEGFSQALDHVLVNQNLLVDNGSILAAIPIHIGSDFPASLEFDSSTHRRASDHDPVRVLSVQYNLQIFLPLVP